MTLLEASGYSASLAMGVALGLTGGGGSILTVPILVYLFGVLPVNATAYSLAIVGLVALWGTWTAYRSNDLHFKLGLVFGIPGVVGVVFSRRILLPGVPDTMAMLGGDFSKNSLLLVLFSILMLAASLSMIRASRQHPLPAKALDLPTAKTPLPWISVVGLAIGILAGFVGAGGGFLIVPALVTLARLEIKQAVGTSLLVISLQSVLGILGDRAALLAMDPRLFASVAALALLGMSIGSRLRHNISPARLKLGFGLFVLVMGTVIFVREIS
jgi:uncharacterized membrane protein YfcA